MEHCFTQCFTWNGACVDTDASDDLALLTDGDPFPELGGLDGRPLPGGKVRTTYIAAEEVDWDYAPAGRDEFPEVFQGP